MNLYVVKRLLLVIPTLILVFSLMRVIPGAPAYLRLIGDGDAEFTQEQLDDLRAQLGTDKSLPVQYGNWIWDMLRGDFGLSMTYDTSIVDNLKDRLPITIELTILALLLATVVAMPLGIISAVFQDSIGDYISRVIAIAGVAMPTFWTAILLILLLVNLFGWLPPLGLFRHLGRPSDQLAAAHLPGHRLGVLQHGAHRQGDPVGDAGGLSGGLHSHRPLQRAGRASGHRAPRSQERFIAGAYHFGLADWALLAGTVVIEQIFLVPGMGKLLIDSITWRDFTMIQALVMIVALMVLLLNLLVDLMYAWLDPRIRYS